MECGCSIRLVKELPHAVITAVGLACNLYDERILNALLLPDVTIGDNVTIGAGSVVTRDIPSNSIAVGNPCKVIRQIIENKS